MLARRIAHGDDGHEPWYVAGTNRFCTEVMKVTGAKAAIKTGAEGVYMGRCRNMGLGICLKVADGNGRAAPKSPWARCCAISA